MSGGRALLFVTAALVVISIATEVEDLAPGDFDSAAQDFITSEKEGRNNGFPQFPGPRFGLPGYKESHSWENQNDVDYVSPLIFDAKAYKFMYLTTTATESDARNDWIAQLASTVYPGCRKGMYRDSPPGGFSLKSYFDANVDLQSIRELASYPQPSCKDLATHFLSKGLFDGLPLAPVSPCTSSNCKPSTDSLPSACLFCSWKSDRAAPVETHDPNDKLLIGGSAYIATYSRTIQEGDQAKANQNFLSRGFQPTSSYSVSFWYKPKKNFGEGEIFNFGESEDWYRSINLNQAKQAFFAPSVVAVEAGGTGHKLRIRVSTTTNMNYECKTAATTSYLGCFRDSWNRALKYGPGRYGYDTESCAAVCPTFQYFSLQDRGQCFCTNNLNEAKMHGTSTNCPADRRGAAWANDLFSKGGGGPPDVILPYHKWSYVTLSVKTIGSGGSARTQVDLFVDNAQSQVAANTGSSDTGTVSAAISCTTSGEAYVPEARTEGARVWSFASGRRRRRSNQNQGAEIAGLTYWNSALDLDRVRANYNYEQNGVPAWTLDQTASSNNGVC